MRTWGRSLRLGLIGAFAGVLLLAPGSEAITLPASFQDNVVFSGLTLPTAIEFAADGRVFVGQKNGDIKVFDSLTDQTPDLFTNLNQLRTNVHDYWDRGFLGMALDPGFTTGRPYVYVLYTFDAPIGGSPPTYGDGCGDPTGSGCIVSGRLSRLTASGNVMTGSEQVLINDWCQQFPSHSIGSLAFGADGMLYVSGGDGASFNYVDYGQTNNPCSDPPNEGGALRSQDLRTLTDPATTPPHPNTTLDGSVLRLNPDTGAAAAGNPLIGSTDLNARRIIAHGLRNPFRFTIRPGTNEVWLGDVGWGTWEEINRIADPLGSVENFGWPCYEGSGQQPGYRDSANVGICPGLYAAGANAVVPPYYTYNHSAQVVSGESCPSGSSSISGLAFYQGGTYPSAYNGALFFSDYSRKCIWVMFPGGNGLPDPASRATFVSPGTAPPNPPPSQVGPVELQIGPGGDLFYADFDGGTIHRVQYVAQPPPTSGLVAAYSFNEGTGTAVADASGNGNGGAIGTAAWTTSGKYGNALTFNGTGAKVTVPDSSSLHLTTGMTLEAWVFPTTSGNNWRDVIYKGVDDNYYLAGSSGTGIWGTGGTYTPSPLLAPSALALNTWSHLAATYDGQTMRLYLNGTQVASRSQTGPIEVSSGALTIGGDALYGQYFTGRIDEVRVYGSALTATQVQADMNTPIGGGPPPDTEPPTAPSNLTAAAASQSQINLDWTASTDNVGVTGYRVERCQGATCSNFVQVATPSTDAFNDTGLQAATTYRYRVRAQDAVPNLSGYSNIASATTQGVSNTPPTATILTPATGTTWRVGDRIDFTGSGTDVEDGGALPDSAFSWTLVQQHCPSNCHSHTVQTWNGVPRNQWFFNAPDHEYPSYLDLILTVTDSGGLTDTETLRLDPRTVVLTFQSSPSGLQLTVGSSSGTAPFTRTVIEGSTNSISAPSPQTLGGTTYSFSSWSDGGAQAHDVVANAAATYTATFGASQSADLALTKTGTTNGSTATWTLTVRNLGPNTAQNVVVTDTLPSRLTFVSAPGCTYTPATRVVSCTVSSLASSASAVFTLTTTITGNGGGWITNTALATSSTSDPSSANNTATDRVRAR